MQHPVFVRRDRAAEILGISVRVLDRLVGRGLIVGHVQPEGCDPLFRVDKLDILPEPPKEPPIKLEPVCIERTPPYHARRRRSSITSPRSVRFSPTGDL